MKVWNVSLLASELGKDQVSERDQLKYLIFFVTISTLGADPYLASLLNLPNTGFFDQLILVSSVVIAIAGTTYCYTAVRPTERHTGFITRFICLSFPVLIQLFVLSMLVGVISALTIPVQEEPTQSSLVDLVLVVFVGIVYFGYVRYAIGLSYADA